MVGHGQQCPRAIGIFSDHRNVVAFPHKPEAYTFKRLDDPFTRGVYREVCHQREIPASATKTSSTEEASSTTSDPNVSI